MKGVGVIVFGLVLVYVIYQMTRTRMKPFKAPTAPAKPITVTSNRT